MANEPNTNGPAVFLDRDGTMIVEQHYLRDPELVQIFPGASSALKSLQDHGFLLLIVTNQSGIGRGYFSVEEMHRVHERLLRELGETMCASNISTTRRKRRTSRAAAANRRQPSSSTPRSSSGSI